MRIPVMVRAASALLLAQLYPRPKIQVMIASWLLSCGDRRRAV
jgi:hypothetical protein